MTNSLRQSLKEYFKSEDVPTQETWATNDIIRFVINWLTEQQNQHSYPKSIEYHTIEILIEEAKKQ